MGSENAIVDAINDLTRVTLALSGKANTKAEAIRKLTDMSVPPTRIAAILAMQVKDVTSFLVKERKRTQKGDDTNA